MDSHIKKRWQVLTEQEVSYGFSHNENETVLASHRPIGQVTFFT